ncbi:MAG: DUF3054 domain-containing protein [Chloroflexota bacterium]
MLRSTSGASATSFLHVLRVRVPDGDAGRPGEVPGRIACRATPISGNQTIDYNSKKRDPSLPGQARPFIVVALGEAAIFILFAAIGRGSHGRHDGGPLLGTIGTALPFLIGWFVAAGMLDMYSPRMWQSLRGVLRRTALVWIGGAAIGLVIRSLLEHRIVPLTFVAITVIFNGALLAIWHWLALRFVNRARPG